MMRIALLHQYGLGGSGSGVYTRHLAEALALAGHDVHVLCRRAPLETTNLPFRPVPAIPANAPVMYERADTQGSPVYADLTGVELRQALAALRAPVRDFLLETRPEAIVVNHLYPLPVVLRDLLPHRRVPIVVVSHGTALQYLLCQRESMAQQVRAALSAPGTRVVALNAQMRDRLLTFDPNLLDRIVSLPVGVDGDLFHPPAAPEGRRAALRQLAARLGQRGEAQLARALLDVERRHLTCGMFAGRFVADKGVEALLAALQSEHAALPADGAFLLVGDGPLRSRLASEARTLQDNGHAVHLLPCLGREEMALLYQAAHFAVTPSLAGEAFPLVLVEALASGLPVLCPDHTGFGVLAPAMREILSRDVGRDALPTLGVTPSEIRRRLPHGLRHLYRLSTSERTAASLRSLVIPRFDWRGVAGQLTRLLAGLAASRTTVRRRSTSWASQTLQSQSSTR